MKIYHLKFKIPPSRYNINLGNGINIENGDELLVIESLGKNILLNYHRFVIHQDLTEARSLSNGYYSIIKNNQKKVIPGKESFSADRSVRARMK